MAWFDTYETAARRGDPFDPAEWVEWAPPSRPLLAEIATALRGLVEGVLDALLGDMGRR